jgi:RNA polymerase sigma factor (TIGR02999 family)
MAEPSPVTRLLLDWRAGDAGALDRLMPLLHGELRRLARACLRRERPNHTLQATALVNEAYLRLVDQNRANWESRSQFFGVAAQMMRRILVDHARAHGRVKRGAGAIKLSIEEAGDVPAGSAQDVLWLDEALDQLATFDPRLSRLVEMRYFAGLSIEETAAALGVSPATVKREWVTAKAWLTSRLSEIGRR